LRYAAFPKKQHVFHKFAPFESEIRDEVVTRANPEGFSRDLTQPPPCYPAEEWKPEENNQKTDHVGFGVIGPAGHEQPSMIFVPAIRMVCITR
jgi:hypothetical protein